MPAQARKIVGWSIVGLLLLFILINLEDARINFFWIVKLHMPVAFVLFIAAAMGAGAVYALQFIKKYKKEEGGETK